MTDHLVCSQLLEYISEYVDGTLQEELCTQLEEHIHSCHDCEIVVNTLKKTIELYQTPVEESELPKDVRSRLFAKLELDPFIKK